MKFLIIKWLLLAAIEAITIGAPEGYFSFEATNPDCHLEATSSETDMLGNWYIAGVTSDSGFFSTKESECWPKYSGFVLKINN